MANSGTAVRLSQCLIDDFETFVSRQEPVALLTVVHTEGSTYSKIGGQILIGADGNAHGLLSGGCLEGDLAERTASALNDNASTMLEYDLREDDDVFGLGIGCEGLLRIHLQPLLPQHNYAPFAACIEALRSKQSASLELHAAQQGIAIQLAYRAPIELLLLGAGQDVDPLISFAASLGWRVTVSDHRLANIERLSGSDAHETLHLSADAITASLDLKRFDAAVVMSHHLASDRSYLQQLGQSPIGFIGLLGPPHRRDRLLAEVQDAELLRERLRGPVGQRIGGRGPAAIALEIAAELQGYFCTKDPTA